MGKTVLKQNRKNSIQLFLCSRKLTANPMSSIISRESSTNGLKYQRHPCFQCTLDDNTAETDLQIITHLVSLFRLYVFINIGRILLESFIKAIFRKNIYSNHWALCNTVMLQVSVLLGTQCCYPPPKGDSPQFERISSTQGIA